MITPIAAGMSAIKAYTRKMRVTANNVANLNSDGFKKNRATFKTGPGGGVAAHIDRVDTPGHTRQTVDDDGLKEVETSNVDIAEAMTDSISTKAGYKANLKTIQTHDEMLGTLLDTLG